MSLAKKLIFKILVIVLVTREAVLAQTTLGGRCPNVAIQPYFNDNEFSGRWFEYARTPRLTEELSKCIFFEYIPPEDGRITINRRTVSKITNREKNHTAKATVVAPGIAISPDLYDYRVVKTDYENYAVIDACKNRDRNRYHSYVIWILTREPIPSNETVKMALEAAEENRLLTFNLMKTDQKNCPKPPKGKLPTKQ